MRFFALAVVASFGAPLALAAPEPVSAADEEAWVCYYTPQTFPSACVAPNGSYWANCGPGGSEGKKSLLWVELNCQGGWQDP